ncbi:MAG: hypothetical protein QW393_04070, partial [Candidatus Micrarchaeaceae archaeon]
VSGIDFRVDLLSYWKLSGGNVKSDIPREFQDRISEILSERIAGESKVRTLVNQLYAGSTGGGELSGGSDAWISDRFIPNLVWLERDDYSRSLVRALWLSPRFAGTDFMSSRQRDMAQVWTDTARGFLGEIAVGKFFSSFYGVDTRADTTRGKLEDYLSTDIAKVREKSGDWRDPKIKVSIKSTKFNGRWLDVPGNQYEHSDAFILVRLGIDKEHFLAFLKTVSFLRDKLFVEARRIGELDDGQAEELWNEVPMFTPIPAYISGFLLKSDIGPGIHGLEVEAKGRKNRKLLIKRCVGVVSPDSLRSVPEVNALDPDGKMVIVIDPIINSLTNQHFLANSGSLKWRRGEWEYLVGKL